MDERRASLAIFFAIGLCACGSKTGILAASDPPPDSAVVDVAVVDAFDTFPCRWSYGQPTVMGRGAFGWLAGAVHGRLDTVWAQAEELPGSGTVRERFALGDPPRELDPRPPAVSRASLHGLPDGWAQLASDCSLAFFDDDAAPRRLLLPRLGPPPCALATLDADFIDVAFTEPAANRAYRHTTRGAPERAATLLPIVGESARVVLSPDGRLAAGFARSPSGEVTGILVDVATNTPTAGPLSLGLSVGGLSASVDRLRPAALVLLPGRGTTMLVRMPFDASEFAPQVLATTSDGAIDGDTALVTNETEALVALMGGEIAIQPLSGSAIRFLEPPERGVDQLRILLAPGESRGGVLYSYITEDGTSVLAFRTLVCNR